jgi:hypothetical protein
MLTRASDGFPSREVRLDREELAYALAMGRLHSRGIARVR